MKNMLKIEACLRCTNSGFSKARYPFWNGLSGFLSYIEGCS